jgi:DNA-binding NarL/FixJ family response regulator
MWPRNDVAVSGTVVIVDDNAAFRSWARALLDRQGYDVVGVAGDGASGVEAVRALRPDVVLLDVGLPDADGFAVARRLRGETKVVLISARDPAGYAAAVSSCGARGFIPKAELSGPVLATLL